MVLSPLKKFTKLDLHTVGDLLLYFPFRYEDFKSKSIFELMDGEKAVITGTVVTPANVQYYGFKRNRLSFKIKQGEAVIAISFFNQPYLVDKIEMGGRSGYFWQMGPEEVCSDWHESLGSS